MSTGVLGYKIGSMLSVLRAMPASLWSTLCLLLVLAVGCAKSAEGETKAWERNVATVNELMATYPGFKAPLEARLAVPSRRSKVQPTCPAMPRSKRWPKQTRP